MKKGFTLAGATHVALPKNNRKVAFSLAEVLITLGIIGVVAAITIPGLITKYQKKQTAVQLQKAYTELTQAVSNAERDLGSVKDWDIYEYNDNLAWILINYYKGATAIKRKLSCNDGIHSMSGNCPRGVHGGYGTSFIALDGKILYCFMNWIFVDVNGLKGPNIQGKDIFEFRVGTQDKKPVVIHGEGETKESIYTTSGEGACRKEMPDLNGHNGNKCGAVIMQSGWQIPDEYPW